MAEAKTTCRTRGQRTKLTQLVFRSIVESVRQGNYVCAACSAAGVAHNTVLEWIARGEGRDPDRSLTPLYAKFAKALRVAEAEAEQKAVAILNENMFGYESIRIEITTTPDGKITTKTIKSQIRDHRTAIEFLRRRFPERWAAKETRHLDCEVNHHDDIVMSPNDIAIASRIASARLSDRYTHDN